MKAIKYSSSKIDGCVFYIHLKQDKGILRDCEVIELGLIFRGTRIGWMPVPVALVSDYRQEGDIVFCRYWAIRFFPRCPISASQPRHLAQA